MKDLIYTIALMVLMLQACSTPKPSIEELIINAASKLTSGEHIDFQFIISDTSDVRISSGLISLKPQKNPDAYGFDHLDLRMENKELRVIKKDDVIYVKRKNEMGMYSNLRRLGSPLFSNYISNYILPYQYLSILRNHQQFHPNAGNLIEDKTGDLQAVIFDIPDYDFQATFWINVKTYLIDHIDTKDENGPIVYKIVNFTSSDHPFPESDIDFEDYNEYFSGLPEIGKEAPKWTLKNVNNSKVYDNEQFKGKVLVLDFWATWCQPCLQSLPKMDSLYRTLDPQEVRFVSITHEENKDPKNFLSNKNYSQLFLNGNEEVSQAFGLKEVGIPTVFVVDQKGIIRDFESGFQGEQSIRHLKETIDLLLN